MSEILQRVLFVNGVPVDKGGVESAIMEVYRGVDHKRLLIDFAVRKPQKGYFHDEIESYGGRVFNLFEHTKHKGNKKWNFSMDIYSVISLYKLLKNKGPFCAVHIAHPILDGFVIIAAKLAGIPVRIAHSNYVEVEDKNGPNLRRKLTRKLRLLFCKRLATHLWGCSAAAMEFQFGKDSRDIRREVVPCPVNLKKFMSSSLNKEEACKELGISMNKINFLCVGRYVKQKNQLFLVECFAEMTKIRADLQLILVGSGPLDNEIRRHAREYGIENQLIMLDARTYIPLALAASDFFILPSISEGLGIALLEAQASGILCFASDACQPESNMGLIEYLPLEKGAQYWANYILYQVENESTSERQIDKKHLVKFETSYVVPRMQHVYLTGDKYSII
ncbi:glycosyltransferase [Paenibacillus vini]|uniref:Glycosyltransferase EpsF n=1 Tax=Paenibacillus vini TaxID=1476024 RepID=A0ABQ4M6P9_9BACL|nr:glycosyltransferase [Paenibacillus vini]GIP51617.1 putative glycosyltransferase EpsF [Paenibacillus vini]